MEKEEKIIKAIYETETKILEGDYDDFDKIKNEYLTLKKNAEELGIKFLDGINFDAIIVVEKENW